MVLKAPGLLSEVHIRALEGMNAKKKKYCFTKVNLHNSTLKLPIGLKETFLNSTE
jgi:hypothetical protein